MKTKYIIIIFYSFSLMGCSIFKPQKTSLRNYNDFDIFNLKGIDEISNLSRENKKNNYVIIEYDTLGDISKATYRYKMLGKKRYLEKTNISNRFVSTMCVPVSPYKMVDTLILVDENTLMQKSFVLSFNNKVIETNGTRIWKRLNMNEICIIFVPEHIITEQNYEIVINDMSNGNKHFTQYKLNGHILHVKYSIGYSIEKSVEKRSAIIDLKHPYLFKGIMQNR